MSAKAFVIRLGAVEVALHSYLREHADGDVSWTSDARLALAFLSAGAAQSYAARRLGGEWHVTPVDRSGYRQLMVDDEVDEDVDPIPAAAWTDLSPPATILSREQGRAVAAHRAAMDAKSRAGRRAMAEALRL